MKKALLSYKLALATLVLAASAWLATAANKNWGASGTDGNWGTAANWSPTGAPATADSVIFGSGTKLSTTNNLSSPSIKNLTFTNAGYSINGMAFTVSGNITNQAGVNIVNVPVTLTSNPKIWEVAAGSEIDLLGGTLTGTATGSAPFEKTDAGSVRFQNVNIWAKGADITNGAAIIDGGSLSVTNDGVRLVAANGDWAGLIITNGGSLTIGAFNGNYNLKLGNSSSTGTNELDISSGTIVFGKSAQQLIVGGAVGAIGVVNQTGGSILFQNNTNTPVGVLIGNNTTSLGTYNLSGGVLTTPSVSSSQGASYFNFNGGTLAPSSGANAASFFQGLTGAYVQNGGAVINTEGYNLVVEQPLLAGGSGGLAKNGAGVLTLTGGNTYTGPTLVTAGELIVPTSQTGGGSFQAADNTALGVTVVAAGTSLNASALTLGSSTGATNEFFLGAFGNPVSAAITATNLTVNGATVVNIYGAGFAVGQFPLIKYTRATGLSASSFRANILPGGIAGYLSNNVAHASVDLVVTAAPTLLWTGAGNNLWDIGATANWYDLVGQQAVVYSDGSTVQFDDSSTGTTSIGIAANVAPSGVTVTNNALTYSFSGNGIGGPGAFTKSGSGTVIVNTPNTYTGNTVINGGTLQLGSSQVIPGGANEGNVTVNGELDLAGNVQTINGLNGGGLIDSSTGSGALTLGANNAAGVFTGTITNTGGTLALVKTGTGIQTLTGNNGFAGGTTLSGGTLQLAGNNSLGFGNVLLTVPALGVTLASYSGNLTLTNPFYVASTANNYPATFNTSAGDIILGGALTATGPEITKIGYHNLRIASAAAANSTAGYLQLYQGGFVVDGGGWTNYGNGIRTYASGSDVVQLAVTNNGTLAVGFASGNFSLHLGFTGGLSGTNELDVSSGQLILGPAFSQIDVGDNAGTRGVVNQTGGTVLFEILTNTSAGVLLGNSAGSVGSYYLNGGILVAPKVFGGSGSGFFYLNGGTLAPSIANSAANFVSGLAAAYVGNGGAVIDTTNLSATISQPLLNGGIGGLTKLGAGALTLTGTNTYVGATLVNSGELWLPTIQTGGGAITVADGATLGVSLAVPGTSLVTTALTMGSSAGVTNEYNLGAYGDPTAPVVNAAHLTVNGTTYVNVTGLNLTRGQFTLIKYGQSSGLTGTSFVLNRIPVAAYLSNNLANSSIDLVLTTEPSLLWSGSSSGSWDLGSTSNWINLGTLQAAAYNDGAYVRFDDTASSSSVNIGTLVLPGGVWVSNNVQTYTISGAGISGLGGFTKDGAGTVIVSTPNSYTSNTVINAGTFQLAASEIIPSRTGSGSLTVNGKLDLAGNTQTINNLSGSGIIDNSSGNGRLNLGANNSPVFFSGVITNSGGTLAVNIPGTNTVTLTGNNGYSGGTTVSGGTVQIGGTNGLGTGTVSLAVPSAGVTLASYGGGIALTNLISASGSADNPANFDSAGGDIVLNGTVTTAGPDVVKLGTNNLWLNAAGLSVENNRLLLYGGNIIFNGADWSNVGAVRVFAPSGASVHLVITNGATVSIGQAGTGNVNLRLGYTSGLAGTNELDISSGQLLLNESFGQIYAGDTAGTYGAVNQTGGTILFEYPGATTGILLGSSAGSVGWYNLNGGYLITPQVVGGSGTGYFYFNGGTLTPSSGASATNFFSGVTAAYVGNANAIFDTTNIDIVVSQSLLDGGSGGLVKLGSSALTLAGTNSYAGPTLVSNGTLNVSGSLGSNAVVVSASTLAGTGTINGSVTINPNGTLVLGGYGSLVTGTLTINSNLALAGNLAARIDKSEAQSNDTAIVTGTLRNIGAGTLTLNNLGPALAAGDVFQLFNQPVVNGNKLVIASSPGAGLVWQNNLAVNGTVSVGTPQPVITQFSFAGGFLTIQGNNGQASGQYVLYASTNLALPWSNWTPVATNVFDDNGNFNLTTSFNSTTPQEFFILRQ